MFDLKRTGRKRDIGVTVSRGRVAVQAPNHFSYNQVIKHLSSKIDWVLAALAEQATQEREYVSGESFSYLGRRYRLKRSSSREFEDPKLVKGKLNIYVPRGKNEAAKQLHTRKGLESWLKQKAGKELPSRYSAIAARMGVKSKEVRVEEFKARWGSCRSTGIALNWRLIQAPARVIDFVCVHELVHLSVPNHSAAFWDSVRKIVPDFLEHKQWLKLNAHLLMD